MTSTRRSWLSNQKKFILLISLSLVFSLWVTIMLGNRCRPTHLNITVQADQADQASLEIFYDLGQGFQPIGHQVCAVHSGNNGQLVRFFVPDQKVMGVRLVAAGSMAIENIRLVNVHNALIREISPHLFTATGGSQAGVVQSKKGLRVESAMPARGVVLEYNLPLGNHYGFRPLFCAVVLALTYLCLWIVSSLAEKVLRRMGITSRKTDIDSISPALPFWHFFLLSTGVLCLAGGVMLWIAEGWYYPESKQEDSVFQPYLFKVDAERISILREPGNLSLAGTLYHPVPEMEQDDAIILLHGNYPEGSHFPLYRVLATELARQGHLVLTIDFPGFGDSADPFVTGMPAGLDQTHDVRAALRYLKSLPALGNRSIHLIGHSMGAEPVLSVGLKEEQVASVVLIGPPRRVYQRFHYQPDVDFFWNWLLDSRKKVYSDTELPDWFTKEYWRRERLAKDMIHDLPALGAWTHKPVFLIEGELESGHDRRYLRWYYCHVSWPKRFMTLAGANHECNVKKDKDRIVYDPKVMARLTRTLDSWFVQVRERGTGLTDLALNLFRRAFAIDMLTGC